MTKTMCSNHPESQLLCPICDRSKIIKFASQVTGKKGGKKVLKTMTPEQRKARAQAAAQARWREQK